MCVPGLVRGLLLSSRDQVVDLVLAYERRVHLVEPSQTLIQILNSGNNHVNVIVLL